MTNLIFYSIIGVLLIILIIWHVRNVRNEKQLLLFSNEILKRENEVLEFQRNEHLLKMLKLAFRMVHSMNLKYEDGDEMPSDIHIYKIVDIMCEVNEDNKVNMIIHLARPGLLIGYKGRNIDLIKKTMLETLKEYDITFKDFQIEVKETP